MKQAFTLTKVFNQQSMLKRIAFTLAEVLITLGILGVIAALTLPTLIQNHRKHEIETKLVKFYSIMEQAIRLAEIDYGDKIYWEKYEAIFETDKNGNKVKLPNLEYFNKYFAPYLKTVKVTTITRSNYTIVLAYFSDGSIASFDAEAIHYYINKKALYLDSEEHKSKIGKEIFTFWFNPTSNSKYHYGKGVEPYKATWNGSIPTLRTHSALGCKENVTNERAFCTAIIQLNGWKIPKDYPFKL